MNGPRRLTACMASALAFAVGGCAGHQGVRFNPAPAGTPVATIFDWSGGHVLYRDCFGLGGLGAGSGCTIYAQGRIAAIKDNAGNNIYLPPGVSFTYTLVVKAISSAQASYDGFTPRPEAVIFSDAADTGSLFVIYTNTPDNTDPRSGSGYDDGTQILRGKVKVRTFSLANVGSGAPVAWDQFGPNNYPGVMTRRTAGSPSFEIDVDSKDDRYFIDPLSMFTVSFSPDAMQMDNSAAPFVQTDPAAKVAGQVFNAATDSGTDGVVDIYCGTSHANAAFQKCSAQLQGDALTRFLTTPP